MSWIEVLFEWVVRCSLQATVLILLVLIVQRLFQAQLGARWRAGLWLLVIARLLLPVTPTTTWSVFHFARPATAVAWIQRWLPPQDPLPRPAAEAPTPDPRLKTGMQPEARTSAVVRPESVGRAWRSIAWLWLAGCLALSLRLLWQNAWFLHRLRRSRDLEDEEVRRLLTECRQELGVHTPLRLVETNLVQSPALYGLWRWRLLWPTAVMARLSREEQRHVLLHELAHLKRKDPPMNWLLSLLRLVHWFNPLVWHAFRRLRCDRELACDELVLTRVHGEVRLSYGQTIIRLLELANHTARNPALTGIAEHRDDLERRIAMIAKFRPRTNQPLVALALTAGLGLITLTNGPMPAQAAPGASEVKQAPPSAGTGPRIVATSPKVGAMDVNPAVTEITVTFDRDMAEGFSWTGGGPDFPKSPEGGKAFWRDKRTCVLPVTLAAGHYYRVGINSTSFRNFKSAEGVPAQPSAIYFTTKGAGEDLKRKTAKPEVTEFKPANGAQDVSPSLTELRVTFSVPMGGGFSWTGGGPEFPKAPEGKRPSWTSDGRTCVLPVQLEPSHSYRLGLNSPSHKNFQSAGGVPLDPVIYTFKTAAK